MLDFPGGDKEQECNGCVCRCAGTEDNVTGVVVPFVTARAEITTTRSNIGDNGEGE